MKRFFSVLLVAMLMVVVLRIYFTRIRNAPSENEHASIQQPANLVQEPQTQVQTAKASGNSPAPPTPQNAFSESTSPQSADLSAQAGQRVEETNVASNLPPEILLQNIRRVVHQYGDMFGGNPVGNNPEITAALAGQNPRHIDFLRGQPGMTINEKGELVDSWGTPYFFHQLSGTVMEIRSAGPDKVLWNSDDLVTR